MSGKYPPSNRNRYNNRYKNAEDADKSHAPQFSNRDNNSNPRYDNRKNNRIISRVKENEGEGLNMTPTINATEILPNPNVVVESNVEGGNVEEYIPKEFDKWEDLEGIIDEDIMRGIYAYGFDTPSLIQRKALLTMFDKRDIIAQAQSGTGKTGVFTIGALQNIDPKVNDFSTNKRTCETNSWCYFGNWCN
jgi:hypothetical protein